jgi:hypothetical protein
MDLWNKLCRKHDYVSKYSTKDLIVYLPTRSNPKGLIKTLLMMRENCDSISNFDVLVIVDDDQVEMYRDEKDKYIRGPREEDDIDFIADYGAYELYGNSLFDNIIWSYSKYDQGADWWNIFNIRNEFLKDNDYYFDALWTDDFVGLSLNWDKNIVSKKHYFEDDIFTLHQSKEGGGEGRLMKGYKGCYTGTKYYADHEAIWREAECLPVTTRKMSLMVNEAIKPNYLTSQGEMLVASVIMLLYKEYGHNRLVSGDYSWDNFIHDEKHNTLPSAEVGIGGFKNKRACFDNWTWKENFSVIRPIVEEINRIIIYEQE